MIDTENPVRVETAYRCADCGHAHDHHERNPGRRCSHDWCRCTKSAAQIKETGEPYDRPVYKSTFGQAGRA